MIRALLYLRWRSLANRLRVRLLRLKQPKYLVGALVGLGYFYVVFFRHALTGSFGAGGDGWGSRSGPPAEYLGWLELIGAWLLLVVVAAVWVLPSRRSALEFSEAEIQFLFPAPITRRGLIRYKLVSWQVGLLLTSVVVSLMSGRLFQGDRGWMAVLGWWVALLLLQLHTLGASFARALLLERQVGQGRRVGFVLGALALVVVLTVVWGRQVLPPLPAWDDLDPAQFGPWLEGVSGHAPLAWLLAPMRWVARLVLTREPGEFVVTLLPVLALMAVHYAWVMRAEVAFEESAVADARAAAERAGRSPGARVSGPARARSRRRGPFPLPPLGPRWVALAWKNLIAAGGVFRERRTLWGLFLLALACLTGARYVRDTAVGGAIGSLATLFLALSVLVGPGAARFDLRLELPGSADTLRALPLRGREVVCGELLAPWIVLTLVQVGLALLMAALLPDDWLQAAEGVDGRRLVLFSVAILLAPPLALLGLALQNAAVLLFPAWILSAPGQPRGGFEVMGQMIIVLVGQLFVFVLALLPAVGVGAAAFMILGWAVGPWWAAVPAALVASAALLAEAAALVLLLGWLWDRTDLARELGG